MKNKTYTSDRRFAIFRPVSGTPFLLDPVPQIRYTPDWFGRRCRGLFCMFVGEAVSFNYISAAPPVGAQSS